MKIKPAKKGGKVLVELGKREESLLNPTSIKPTHILVPVDFSDCSRKALSYAAAFAQQFDAKVTLLHVVQLNYLVGTEFASIDFSIVEKELKDQAEKELAAMGGTSLGIKCDTMIRVGQPVFEITEAARKTEADLIILATHGRTGFRHVVLGSVAENVVRYAPCPVLVVRENEHEFIREPTLGSTSRSI